MRVALYARVSTQRQAQAQTVEQQMGRLTDHAQQQGWDVPPDQIFRDDGYSGASLRRPGLDRLRDRVAARSLDVVLITAPDRLARNYVHQVLLLEELQGHGCEVRFLDRPMSQDPHDQLLLQIRGAVAEYERTLITERMRRGRQRKLEAGLMLPWTRPPFGYRVDPERPRDPAGIRIEEVEAAIVREMFAWYAEEAHSFCSLARLLEQRAIRTSTGLRRWNLASIRALLTNPAYAGRVYGNRWHRRGALERRSATAPRQHSAMSRVDAPRDEWILVAEIPPLVSQEQFDRVQARLVSNRRFAQRNNKAHPYLLRGLVSCGLCGLACLARTTAHSYRYYSCTGKLPALFSHREQKCPSRLSPAERLDELVWADLCELLTHPEQVSQALARAQGGQWLPQELQARQEGLRRGQVSLGQQLERLTEAYLAGVVLLDEYRRRRSDLERRQQQLEEQVTRLEAQADRQKELAGLSRSVAKFSQRVQQGLGHASFEQKRSLMELLIDRVIVTDGEVEIRYVMPTTQPSEQVRFCHLQLDYRRVLVVVVSRKARPCVPVHRAELDQREIAGNIVQGVRIVPVRGRPQIGAAVKLKSAHADRARRTPVQEQDGSGRVKANQDGGHQHDRQADHQYCQRKENFQDSIDGLRQSAGQGYVFVNRNNLDLSIAKFNSIDFRIGCRALSTRIRGPGRKLLNPTHLRSRPRGQAVPARCARYAVVPGRTLFHWITCPQLDVSLCQQHCPSYRPLQAE